MKYTLAIFDFDGTLADSMPFFVKSINVLADRHGFAAIDPQEVPLLRHLSPRELMRRVGLPAHRLPFVAKDFIALMRTHIDAIQPFPGTASLLAELKQLGVSIAIVSSNASDNVERVLGSAATSMISDFACGMSIFGKGVHLRRILRRAGVSPGEAIYIGDQSTDLKAAHEVGIAFGAVAWGYGLIDDLQTRGANHAFHEMAEIAELFSSTSPAR